MSTGMIPDDPMRVAAPGELECDYGYDESTELLDVDSINDLLWLEENI